jgi:hypothetical protein
MEQQCVSLVILLKAILTRGAARQDCGLEHSHFRRPRLSGLLNVDDVMIRALLPPGAGG